MKRLKDYILEATEDNKIIIKNLKVIYKPIKNKNFILCVPNNYSESDAQIYIDDKLLKNLPGTSKESKELLGDNYREISDAYFSYKSYEASSEPKGNIDLDWDDTYNGGQEDINEFVYYTFKDFKYTILFERFELYNMEDNADKNIKETLENIFKSLESNIDNDYLIQLEFNSLTYDK